MKSWFIFIFITLLVFPAYGGGKALIIVSDFGKEIVATTLEKKADYVALPITLTNDRSDTKLKYDELKKSVRLLENRVKKEPKIILYRGPVFQPNYNYSKFSFSSSGKKSSLTMYVLFQINDNTDIFDASAKLESVIRNLSFPGDTDLDIESISLGVMEPEKYRKELLEKIQSHIQETASVLKNSQKITVSGLEKPVRVVQSGGTKVNLFIDYELSIISNTTTQEIR